MRASVWLCLLAGLCLGAPLLSAQETPTEAEPAMLDFFFLTGGPYTQKENSSQIIWAYQWFRGTSGATGTRGYAGPKRFEWDLARSLRVDFEFGTPAVPEGFAPSTLAGAPPGTSEPEQQPAASVRRVPELITDRPDQTESAVIVPPGYVQIETGWTFARNDEEGVRQQTHELPGTLVRIGLVDGVELRAGWSGYIQEEVRVGSLRAEEDGIGDAELGTKIRLCRENGVRPEVALIVAGSLPIGSDGLSTERVDPSFRFSLSHTLSDRFALGYNVGMFWESEVDETRRRSTLSNYLYTATLGIGLTERLGTFVELFGEIPASAVGDPAHSFDSGLTYLLRNNLQLDVAAGVGLSQEAPDWFVGVGISVRFPQ